MSAADIARLEERILALQVDVSHIRAKIDGNGRPGLITRVTLIEDRMRARATSASAVAMIAAAIVGGASSILVALLG